MKLGRFILPALTLLLLSACGSGDVPFVSPQPPLSSVSQQMQKDPQNGPVSTPPPSPRVESAPLKANDAAGQSMAQKAASQNSRGQCETYQSPQLKEICKLYAQP